MKLCLAWVVAVTDGREHGETARDAVILSLLLVWLTAVWNVKCYRLWSSQCICLVAIGCNTATMIPRFFISLGNHSPLLLPREAICSHQAQPGLSRMPRWITACPRKFFPFPATRELHVPAHSSPSLCCRSSKPQTLDWEVLVSALPSPSANPRPQTPLAGRREFPPLHPPGGPLLF